MSLYDYRCGRDLDVTGASFYGLIQAALRHADSDNLRLLQEAFPATWHELQARYNAPGGILESDPESTP